MACEGAGGRGAGAPGAGGPGSRRVRTAIVGTGAIAAQHAAALRAEQDRAELVAAVDIDEARARAFAEAHGVPAVHSDLDAMLERERPELVLICTPPSLHSAQCIRSLEAGAWVLCEKPLAGSLRELDAIQEAEARSGATCSSVYQWRFGAGARHLQRLIAEGALGRPMLGLCQTTWYRDDAYYAVPWRGSWATELGGTSMIHGIHAMDLLLWLFGPWAEVSAMAGTLGHAIEVEDVAVASVRFESGALGTILNSAVSPRQESVLRLDFARATVELHHLYGYRNDDWRYTLPDGSPDDAELARWEALPPDVPSLHQAQLSHVLDCLERGERPLTSGPGARATLEFLASLYASAFTGTRVERGSITPGDSFYDAMSGDAAHGNVVQGAGTAHGTGA